jgi:SAM-dependent methyltransferase
MFLAFLGGLEALRAWLLTERVTHLAMEATSSYWLPVWRVLEEERRSRSCCCATLAMSSMSRARKTDGKDASWLAQSCEVGLLHFTARSCRTRRNPGHHSRLRTQLGHMAPEASSSDNSRHGARRYHVWHDARMDDTTFTVRDTIGGRKGIWARLALKGLAWRIQAYQPVLLDGKVIAEGHREHERRLGLLLGTLASEPEVATVADLGCAEGYFVRRLAEAGYLAVGVDADAYMLALAQWSLTLDGVQRFGFIRLHLDADSVRRVPATDVTVCFSLLHHIVLAHGVDHARRMLEAIRERTRRLLVFEMGQSDETAFAWAARLPDMGPDPHEWVAQLLRDGGWKDVRKIGETEGFRTEARRAMFTGRP